jgi:hypothetical protein
MTVRRDILCPNRDLLRKSRTHSSILPEFVTIRLISGYFVYNQCWCFMIVSIDCVCDFLLLHDDIIVGLASHA